ncbi:MAG: zinc finger domain-containing protein, partial [Myxococcota bacterium]|nr:zinc finger domain-containing protein [Myxococcota bacterium]
RRFSLRLRSGACVDHLSQRGFGWILIQGADEPPPIEREKLGPDAYQLCAVPSQFQSHLRAVASRRGIKAALLDQSCLAGVGNIYALEGLFHASIHPATKIELISDAALEMLAEGIYQAMHATLDAHQGGVPIRYNSGIGAESPFQCYGRAGFPCHRCGTTLMLLRQGGRRSDLCPRCQPL